MVFAQRENKASPLMLHIDTSPPHKENPSLLILGHVQYTRNMATGASTANVAIILIDARHGVLTQSRRHAYIASLLGIPHLLVCVNKLDLVDYSEERYKEIEQDFLSLSDQLRFKSITCIPVSALMGVNIVEPNLQMSPLVQWA